MKTKDYDKLIEATSKAFEMVDRGAKATFKAWELQLQLDDNDVRYRKFQRVCKNFNIMLNEIKGVEYSLKAERRYVLLNATSE